MFAILIVLVSGSMALIWAIMSILVVGHLIRYRSGEPGTWLAVTLYLIISTIIITTASALLYSLPWQELIPYV